MRRAFHARLPAAVAGLLLTLAVPLAMATELVFHTTLSGSNESPPNGSAGTGTATVIIDDVDATMRVMVDFSGLSGPNTAAHIHCCTAIPFDLTAGVATITPTFVGFPSGSSGSYDVEYDMTQAGNYRGGFIAANGLTAASAFAALLAGLEDGRAYLNIHTQANPGGEIRGFLQLVQVPEPASTALAGLALLLLAGLRRQRGA